MFDDGGEEHNDFVGEDNNDVVEENESGNIGENNSNSPSVPLALPPAMQQAHGNTAPSVPVVSAPGTGENAGTGQSG
jgi:hypothetical protein